MLDAPDQVSVYDQLTILRGLEFRSLIEVWLLLPEKNWQFYQDRVDPEYRQLKECKMLRAAQKTVREAWRKRIVIFLKEKDNAA